jgi:type II secretory pathway component PulF
MKRALGTMLATIVVLAIFYRALAPAFIAVFDALNPFIADSAAGSAMLGTLEETVLLWVPLIILTGSIVMLFAAALRRRGTSRRVRR